MNALKFNQIEFNHIGEQPSMPLQEKSVTITANGTTEVVPDNGYALEKVNIITDIKGSGGGGIDPNDPESEFFIEYFNINDWAKLGEYAEIILSYGAYDVKVYDETEGFGIYPSGIIFQTGTEILTQISFMPNKKIYAAGNSISLKQALLEVLGLLQIYNSLPRITKEEFYNFNV